MGTFDQNSYTSFRQNLLSFAGNAYSKLEGAFLTCASETIFIDIGVKLYSNEGNVPSSLRSSRGYFISCFTRKIGGDVIDAIFPPNDADNYIVSNYVSNIYLQISLGLAVAPLECKFNDDGFVNFLDNPGYQCIDKFLSGLWAALATVFIEGFEAYLLKEPISKGVLVGALRVAGALLLESLSKVYNAKSSMVDTPLIKKTSFSSNTNAIKVIGKSFLLEENKDHKPYDVFDQVTTSDNDDVIESNVSSSMANISLIAQTPFWSNTTTTIEGI